MSRPVQNEVNRSGLGNIGETDRVPLDGQDDPTESPGLGQEPDEQAPGHDHDDPDTPDHVHPALKVDDSADDSADAQETEDTQDTQDTQDTD